MGWKLATLFIHPAPRISGEELLTQLGFKNKTQLVPASFDSTLNPDPGTAYVGYHNGGIIISSWDLLEQCLTPKISPLEQKLLDLFPGSEIGAAGLHSVVNFWGLSLIANGKKQRVLDASADTGVRVNFGSPLPIEKQEVPEEGCREDDYDEDFDWEGLVLQFASGFYGGDISMGDTDLDIPMEGWRIAAPLIRTKANAPATSGSFWSRLYSILRARRKKYLGLLILLILMRIFFAIFRTRH
jgi:hypothetical protein